MADCVNRTGAHSMDDVATAQTRCCRRSLFTDSTSPRRSIVVVACGAGGSACGGSVIDRATGGVGSDVLTWTRHDGDCETATCSHCPLPPPSCASHRHIQPRHCLHVHCTQPPTLLLKYESRTRRKVIHKQLHQN